MKKGSPIFGDPYWIDIATRAATRNKVPGKSETYEPWATIRGDGPDGKTCKTCKHLSRGHRGKYFKCSLSPITNGPGTDIRMKDRACRLYEREKI